MKTLHHLKARSALLAALLFSGPLMVGALAQNMPSPSSNTNTTKLGWGDRHFLNNAAKSGMEEVAISRVAAERATNPDVKALAQKIVSDHESTNNELMQLASTEGVDLPDSMEKHDMKLTEKWQKKDSGTDFDKAYLKQMVDDHEDAIDAFQKAAKSDNAQIAALAGKTLPTLQQHRTRAEALRKQLGD
jgi:putative membrane protein